MATDPTGCIIGGTGCIWLVILQGVYRVHIGGTGCMATDLLKQD